MATPPFDVNVAHRWFAIECNNLAWDLLEKPNRTAAENENLLHAAHASCWHWSQIGTVLNQLRGECLLANVSAALGHGESALRHAQRCVELCGQEGAEPTTFDRATAFACLARAHACRGNTAEAKRFLASAREVAAELDAEDRPVFEQLATFPM